MALLPLHGIRRRQSLYPPSVSNDDYDGKGKETLGKGRDKKRSPKLVKDRYQWIKPIGTNSKTCDKKMYGRLLITMVHLDIEQFHERPDADRENRARTVTSLPEVLSGSGTCRTYSLRAELSKGEIAQG